MLSNESPITKSLLGMQEATSKIQEELKQALQGSQDLSNTDSNKNSNENLLSNTMKDMSSLKQWLEKLINNFEDIRGKLYPVAEKIALIELEK